MCGISGFISQSANSLESIAAAMLDPIARRGPDDSGIWCNRELGVSFGHRRLSILDLSAAGHQPMHSASKRFVTTFNGEIYNFRTLRIELENLGAKFRGTSDTEVLLALIESHGIEKAVSKLTGMFAFAVLDLTKRKLHLVRDRLGEKPLYYGWIGEQGRSALFFSSDLAAIVGGHKHFIGSSLKVEPASTALFLKHSYIPAPHTIYEGIYKLQAGALLTLDLEHCYKRPGKFSPFANSPEHLSPKRYWELAQIVSSESNREFSNFSPSDAADELELRLLAAIKNQMISDVPIGAFLSGGIDSSTVVALMQAQSSLPIETFSIGFSDSKFDEAPYARKVASHLRTNHHELYLNQKDLLDVVPKLSNIFTEPFADSSQIPTYLVSKLARTKVTVALSGDGGDEVFAGYPRLLWAGKLANLRAALPSPICSGVGSLLKALSPSAINASVRIAAPILPRSLVFRDLGAKLRKVGEALSSSSNQEMYDTLLACSEWDSREIALPFTTMSDSSQWPCCNFRDWVTWADTCQYLPDQILVKVDRCAMANSLETRVPFLDHNIIEFIWSLTPALRRAQFPSKPLLRSVLGKYLPADLYERPKMGFAVPIGDWLRTELRDWAESLITKEATERLGLVEYSVVKNLWDQHRNHTVDHSQALWSLLMLIDWRSHN